MKSLKIVVVAAISAMLFTGCGDTSPVQPDKRVVEPSESSTATSAPKQDGTASRPFDLGTLATSSANSRWDVTVTETVTTGGAAQILAENPYNEVKNGWDYVLGRMTSVVNDSLPSADAGEPMSPTSVMPVFIGSDGRIYDIWNDDNSAVVMEEDWVGQPDIIARTGIESTGRFAIQVPSDAIAGGQFATRNEVNGTVLYFGEPAK